MKIWCYSITRNEHVLMPHWITHHSAFCERLVVYDDQSDDGTRKIVQDRGIELRDYPAWGIDEFDFNDIWYAAAEEAKGKADWILCCDTDEFAMILEAPRPEHVALELKGYQMISETLPEPSPPIIYQIREGYQDDITTKMTMWRPEVKAELGPGRHTNTFDGEILRSPHNKLLHYRCLGLDYMIDKSNRQWKRLSDRERNSGYSWHDDPNREEMDYKRAWYGEAMKKRVQVI